MPVIELSRPIRLFAPAKVNLGLEITGRRADGYHNVVTILQTVSLFDVIDVSPAKGLAYEPPSEIPADEDLLGRALHLAEDQFGIRLYGQVQLTKRIPIAAGLGGGSSDAGTLLGALGRLAGVPSHELERAAATLGSDVPFFVQGGTALATGTGTDLTHLPESPRLWFLLAVPSIAIPNKTKALYAQLTAVDYSDGNATKKQFARLSAGEPFEPALLRNSFDRALLQREGIQRAAGALHEAGAMHIIPSGAGPWLVATMQSFDRARHVSRHVTAAGYRAVICTTIKREINAARLMPSAGVDVDWSS